MPKKDEPKLDPSWDDVEIQLSSRTEMYQKPSRGNYYKESTEESRNHNFSEEALPEIDEN